MNLKKRELIITVIMIITFLVLGLNSRILAANGFTLDGNVINFAGVNTANNSNTNNNGIERVNTTNNVTPNTTNNTANNTPGQLANTGLEDAPWLIVGICAISAVFAYNKIKEYKSI